MTYRYKASKKKKFNKRVIIKIIPLLLLLSLIYVLLFSPIFKIKEILISGNKKISAEEIKNNLTYNNIFLTTTKTIKNQLLQKFPGILDLKISKNVFNRKLEINIQERESVGIFCTADECFYFDKNGIAFEKAPNTSGSLIDLIKDYSQKEFKMGDEVLDKNLMDNILTIKNELFQKIGLRVTSFDIDTYPVEELRVVTNESWYILFSLKRDIKSQLLALKVALDEKIQNRSSLQYIDLRIENRIYYK
jgi:hypothetical protein